MTASRVLFVAPGPIETWASSRLRGLWPARHIPGAQIVNIQDRIIPDAGVYIWIKKTTPDYLERPGVHVWDICDPVHWFQPRESDYIADHVAAVVASNEGLAADFESWSGVVTRVIPDRLDLGHYPLKRGHQDGQPVKLIWFGAAQNRVALFSAVPALERLKAHGADFTLTICDDAPDWHWSYQTSFPVEYERWELGGENAIISRHDIAILPPYPGEWGKVKSNNKHLTAWACGLAVWDGADYYSLQSLAMIADLRREQAELGLARVKARYDVKQSAAEWQRLIAELMG